MYNPCEGFRASCLFDLRKVIDRYINISVILRNSFNLTNEESTSVTDSSSSANIREPQRDKNVISEESVRSLIGSGIHEIVFNTLQRL